MKTTIKGIKELAKAAREGKLTGEAINEIIANVENTLRTARRKHIAAKRDPRKVKAAVKKAAATRERRKKEAAKWAKIAEKERKEAAARLAAGYLHEEVTECHAGFPNPKYYFLAGRCVHSGYDIYRLRAEYVNKPVPGATMWVPLTEKHNDRWF
jgi:hypothetical protein